MSATVTVSYLVPSRGMCSAWVYPTSGWTGLSAGDARSSSIGLWWADLLAAYQYRRSHAA